MTISSLERLDPIKKWYFDACAFEERVYGKIITLNEKHGIIIVTSHLALGEAFCTCMSKGPEKLNPFLNLIKTLNDCGYLQVVGNDDIHVQLDHVSEMFDELDFTDRVHLATALKYHCGEFKSTDRHFLGLRKKQLIELAQKNSMSGLVITAPPTD